MTTPKSKKTKKAFEALSLVERQALMNEFNAKTIVGVPDYGTREWYLIKFSLWVGDQLIDGHNPLV